MLAEWAGHPQSKIDPFAPRGNPLKVSANRSPVNTSAVFDRQSLLSAAEVLRISSRNDKTEAGIRVISTLITALFTTLSVSFGTDAAPPAVPIESLELETGDGARLRGRRYISKNRAAGKDGVENAAEAQPVILFHGLVASLHQFDLDEKDAPALAQFLARKGWDVWAFNFRGAGRGPLRSALPDGQRRWSADEMIVEDIPTVLEHVRKTTGKRPFLIGHSLGGMTTAAYLSGAKKIDEENIRHGIEIDPKIAKKRNAEVLGAAFLSAPGTLRWTEATSPNALTRLSKFAGEPLRLLLPAQLAISAFNGSEGGDRGESSKLQKTGDRVQKILDTVFGKTNWSTLAFGPKNSRRARNMLRKMRGGVLGDTSEDLLLQLASGARTGKWESYRGPANVRVNYADHYANVTTPVYVAVGADDRVADASVSESAFFEKISSSRRVYTRLEGYGHSATTLADDAHAEVFQPLEAWMRQSLPDPSAEKEESPKRTEESKSGR